MITAILNYTFMQNAFLSALFASIISGIIGSIIIEKKLVSMSGGIAHASFGGIGLGYYIGIEPILGGLIFAIASSLGVYNIQKKNQIKSDAIINIFWSVGMALGILLITLKSGYAPDLTSYLFGDILTVSNLYVLLIFILCIITLFIIIIMFNHWKIYLFDREYAKVLKVKVIVFDYLLYILIPLTIILLVKVSGIILAIALLTIPPSLAKVFCHNLKGVMIVSSFLSVIFCVTGLAISYYLNIPSGASIIILSAVSYFIVLLLNKIRKPLFHKHIQ